MVIALAPETIAQHIVNNSNALSVTNYTNGVTTEAYTFNHEQTQQTSALTDYRYIGANPNNYVNFNCDNDGTNCEIWRAIGVFSVDDGEGNVEQRVKLVRGYNLNQGSYWNSSGSNDWTTASLKTFLNGDYYNHTGTASTYGLKESARNMISNTKYYLGAWRMTVYDDGETYLETYGTPDDMYSKERGNTVCGACNSDSTKLSWIGKVGLMYPSDNFYVYAKNVNIECYSNGLCHEGNNYSNQISNSSTGWIYNSNLVEGHTNKTESWFISPNTDSSQAYNLYVSGTLSVGVDDQVGEQVYDVRPVVYLNPDVLFVDVDGSVQNPYVIE